MIAEFFSKIGNFISFITFSGVATTIGIFSDLAVLALTWYTLHITAISRKLEFISISSSMNIFFGDSMALYLMNKSLHAIPVRSVFVLKRYSGQFYHIPFAEFKEPPIIESWNIKRIDTGAYTKIETWSNTANMRDIHSEIIKDAVIGVDIGKTVLWVKPCKKSPLKQAIKAFKKRQYMTLTVLRETVNNIVLSPAVNCLVGARMKDVNGQYCLKEIFGILAASDGGPLLLNESLCGYNAFSNCGNDARTIKAALSRKLGLDEDDIAVDIFRENGSGRLVLSRKKDG